VGFIGSFVFFSSFAVWYIIKNIMGLRVSLEDETQGIDISEFGQMAYTFDNFQQLSSEGAR
jgi:Amt family ammonium transporter